jgi:outer membrane receptor protein involved in Fe transport
MRNILLGVLIGLTAVGALAQEAAEEQLTEVVVTGSRVVKNGNDSPTPVTVINVADSEQIRPATIAEQLNDMPQFSGSRGQNNGIGAGSANGGNPNGQANVLNLRNFGFTRTLILFDGHRVAPTSPDGTVDVDMVPQLLLKRVDVVTGGASAVYGADAVTGVVNFVSDTEFKGLKVNGQAGQSIYSDDRSKAIGVAWGADLFGGRGHVMASYEFRGNDGVDRRSSREWFRRRPFIVQVANSPTLTQYQLIFNATNNDRAFGGVILPAAGQPTASALYNQYFASNGALSPVDFGTRFPTATSNVSIGGSGAYFDPSLKGELEMHQLFGRFDYDFTDAVHGYFKASGTRNYNAAYSLTQPTYNPGDGANFYNLFANNPYLPQAVQTSFATNPSGPITRFRFNKIQNDVPRQFTESSERQYSFDTGLNGQFGDGWKWELALVHANNRQQVGQEFALNGRKLAAALDAVTVTAANVSTSGQTIGSIVCNVALTNPGLYPGCVPYNPFGPNTTTQANLNYIFEPLQVVAATKMNDVEAFVSGAPFNSWAGPVNMALSAQFRKLSYRLDSSSVPSDAANPLVCTGLRLATCGTQSQTYFQASSYSRAPVSVTVREAALEFDLPLLTDKPFAQDVSLNSAVRYTNYSTSGSVNTWKVGLDWKITDTLSIRGTRSRDIRAPTLFELYRPTVVGNNNIVDPLTGVVLNGGTINPATGLPIGSATTYTTGNANLKPEIGDTTTLGLVYRPGWAPGLSLALDSYYINIKDAILQLDGANGPTALACSSSGGTSPVCSLITRPINCCSQAPGNSATAYYATGVNIARNYTRGADLEVNYSSHLFNKPYNLRLLTSYQPKNVVVNPITGGWIDNAGFYGSNPTWRATLVAGFSLTENFKISVQERWRNSMSWTPKQYAPLATLVLLNAPPISSVFYTNLNMGYTFKNLWGGQAEAYANIQNLFDREAPIASGLQTGFPGNPGPVAADDIIGRYYTLGFRYRL